MNDDRVYAEGPPPETNYMTWEDESGAWHWAAVTLIRLSPRQKLRRLCSLAEHHSGPGLADMLAPPERAA